MLSLVQPLDDRPGGRRSLQAVLVVQGETGVVAAGDRLLGELDDTLHGLLRVRLAGQLLAQPGKSRSVVWIEVCGHGLSPARIDAPRGLQAHNDCALLVNA